MSTIGKDLCKTAGFMCCATLIAYLFLMMSQTTTNIAIIYMMFIVFTARSTSGYKWGFIASLIGTISINFFFTDPYMELNFMRDGYLITFAGVLAISLLTSTTTTHLKEQQRLTASREQILDRLNSVNSQLLTIKYLEQTTAFIVDYVYELTDATTALWMHAPGQKQMQIAHMQTKNENNLHILYAETVKAKIAAVSFQKEPIQYREAACMISLYPLVSHGTVWGILSILEDKEMNIPSDVWTFLKFFIVQAAMALERQILSREHQTLLLDAEKEKMRSNLLRAVSHDLRTPLTGIIGASQTCLENSTLAPTEQRQLLHYIYEDANWLLNMVENLLTVTRIDANGAKVKKTWEPVEEIISESVQRFKKRYPAASVLVKMDDRIMMAPMDPILIEQVILNLLENAIKHSGNSENIQLISSLQKDSVQIAIIDQGRGLKEEAIPTLFDGYGTTQSKLCDSTKGIGIGLSICKAIVCAHGGTITAQNHEHGAVFTFTIPLKGAQHES